MEIFLDRDFWVYSFVDFWRCSSLWGSKDSVWLWVDCCLTNKVLLPVLTFKYPADFFFFFWMTALSTKFRHVSFVLLPCLPQGGDGQAEAQAQATLSAMNHRGIWWRKDILTQGWPAYVEQKKPCNAKEVWHWSHWFLKVQERAAEEATFLVSAFGHWHIRKNLLHTDDAPGRLFEKGISLSTRCMFNTMETTFTTCGPSLAQRRKICIVKESI